MTQSDCDIVTANLQAIECAAERDNVPLHLAAAKFRCEVSHDAIGSHKVEDVEAFDSSRGVCGDDLIVLPTAGDVAVGGGKAHEMVRAEVFYARGRMAAYGRQ